MFCSNIRRIFGRQPRQNDSEPKREPKPSASAQLAAQGSKSAAINPAETSKSPLYIVIYLNTAQHRRKFTAMIQDLNRPPTNVWLDEFIHENSLPQDLASRLDEYIRANATASGETIYVSLNKLLNLGPLKASTPISIGQEVELVGVRALTKKSVFHGDSLGHIDDQASSKRLVDLVAEVPNGKGQRNALVEAVTTPAATVQDFANRLSRIRDFYQAVAGSGQEVDPKSFSSDALQFKKGHLRRRPCVQTTIGIPLRDTSRILMQLEHGLYEIPKAMFQESMKQTPLVMAKLGLNSSQGKKLWEWLNFAIWFYAASAFDDLFTVEDAESGKLPLPNNKTLNEWRKDAFKKFYGVRPRSYPGDFLRIEDHPGLTVHDQHKLELIFGQPGGSGKISLVTDAALNSIDLALERSIADLPIDSTDAKDLAEIIRYLKENRSGLERNLNESVRDLIPCGNISYYNDNYPTSYGKIREVTKQVFYPERASLNASDHPVTMLWEIRNPNFRSNVATKKYVAGETNHTDEFLATYYSLLTDLEKPEIG